MLSMNRFGFKWAGSHFLPGHLKLCRTTANVAKHKIVPNCLMTPVYERAKCVTPHLKNRPPTVVIVGGGLAGLTAAERLENAGIHDVTILEAHNELGGRIKSCKMGRTNIELGAFQIEGASIANPIYNLANIECLLCPGIKRKSRNELYFTTDGRMTRDHEEAKEWLNKILTEAGTFFTSEKPMEFWNLYDYVENRLKAVIENLPPEARQDFVMCVGGLMNYLKAKVGEDLKNVSLKEFGSAVVIPGLRLPFPAGAIGLAKSLFNCNVEFQKVVQRIFYGTNTQGPRVLVQCCDGSKYLCDYVIVTVSLGVLKALADMMFQPRLPEKKIGAIQRIGYGFLTVIHFQYAQPFWNQGENFTMRISWSKEETEYSNEWVQGICSIAEMTGPDHVLKVTVVGKQAEWVEKIQDHQVADEFTSFVRKITGDRSLPCPTGIIKSNWCTDIHFMGTKSYLGLGSSVQDQCALAEPLPGPCAEGPPSLMFAGEATCPGYFGTLQGARLSGCREADRIVDLTIELKGAPACPVLGELPPLPSCTTECPPVDVEPPKREPTCPCPQPCDPCAY